MRAFQKGVTSVVLHPLGRLQVQDSPPPPCRESNAGNGLCQACGYVRHRRLEIRDDASAGAVGGSALPQVTELDQQGGQLLLQPPALAS